jgi:hypothetical protein
VAEIAYFIALIAGYLYLGVIFAAMNFEGPYGGRHPDWWRFFLAPLTELGWWGRRTLLELPVFGRTALGPAIILALFWPVKVAWNAATIIVISPILLFR